jgi:hypothetical protein
MATLWVQLKGLLTLLGRVANRVVAIIDDGLSFLRRQRQLVSAWPAGRIELGPRVAVFVHFDGQGAVRGHTLRYVAALRGCGFSVVLVSNSERLTPAALEALRPLCAGVLVRRNIGYDFGAMREGLEYLGLPRADTEMVVIANDSVYGPFGPLDEMINRIDFAKADLWGATDSWQRRYHVQSYFIAAGRKALEHAAWRAFWRSVRPLKSKITVIRRYELGLSQGLLRAGLSIEALWRYHDLVTRVNPEWLDKPEDAIPGSGEPMNDMRQIHAYRIRHNAAIRNPLNPTSDLWRQLIQAGFPFIKRELLRDNPSEVADLEDWRDEVIARFGAIPEAIEHDLRRVMRNRVG